MIHVAKIKSREFVFRKGVILAASPIKILTDQRNEGKLDKKREKKSNISIEFGAENKKGQ